MKRKLTAMLLTVSMLLTLFPFAAFAAEPTAAPATTLPEPVNGVVTLTQDVEVSSLDPNTTYDLNGKNLTLNTNTSIDILKGQTLTIKDSSVTAPAKGGTLTMRGKSGASSYICPEVGGIVNVENIKVDCNATAFYPAGDAAEVNITNCDVVSTVYGVATNAGSEKNYGVIINLKDSSFKGDGKDFDNCPVFLNVPGTLNMDNCTVIGDRQAVLVRAGDANITNSNIVLTGKYTDNNGYESNKAWRSGNEVPMAAVLVGDQSSGAYHADAIVKVSNTKVEAQAPEGSVKKPAFYVNAEKPSNNKPAKFNTALTLDKATVTGDIVTADATETTKTDVTVQNGTTINGTIKAASQKGDVVVKNSNVTAVEKTESAKNNVVIDKSNVTKVPESHDFTIMDSTVANQQITSNKVAMIGNAGYDTLGEAVKAAKAGDTIVLVQAVTIPAGPENNLVLDKQVTIDGQGHKITRTFDKTAGDAGYGNYEAVFNVNAEGVVIKNVVFNGLDGGSKDEAAIYVNSNNTTIEGCTFNGGADSGITGILTPGGVGKSLTINNNKFNNLKYGMYFNAINDSIISGNTIDGTKYTGIFVTGSNVTVKDNVLTNIGTAGGNFDPMFYTGIYTTGAAQEKPNTVTGNKVTLAEGNTSGQADNAGNPVVVGNVTYKTLAEAVAAVKNGETITLKADNAENITVSRNVYFNLVMENGAKFTGTIVAGDGYVLSQSGNQYTIYIPTPVAPSYQVTVPTVQNGTVAVTPQNAAEGATVTITATPDKGFVVDTVVVKDATGKVVTVTKNADGTYSFKMPASKVDVAVTFKAEQAAPTVLPFVDVAENDWFYPAVGFVYEQGMMAGMSDTVFAPNVTLSRAMMAQVLYNLEGTPTAGGQFTDVKDGDWYANAVNWAAKEGIVAGMGDGTFAPNDNLTREQMAAILYRFAKYSGFDMSAKGDLAGFADANKVSPWAQESMSWAVGAKIVSGMGDNTLAPQGTATRAQVAMVLLNFCANMNK